MKASTRMIAQIRGNVSGRGGAERPVVQATNGASEPSFGALEPQ